MNLHHLLMLRTVALLEATRTDTPEVAPSSTRAAPMFYPTLADMGLAPVPEPSPEQLAAYVGDPAPGPMNRQQKRTAARNARRSVVRRLTL